MKAKIFYALILFSILISLGFASAWNTNFFNNSLISENLTYRFPPPLNITRYLSIPNTVGFITNAYLNLSGFTTPAYHYIYDGSVGEQYAVTSGSCSTVHALEDRVINKDLNTFGSFNSSCSGNGLAYVKQNYTIRFPSVWTSLGVNFTKTSSTNFLTNVNFYLWNWNMSQFDSIYECASCADGDFFPSISYLSNYTNSTGDGVFQVYVGSSMGALTSNYVRVKVREIMIENESSYPTNVKLYLNNTSIISGTGEFNQANNKTINMYRILNNYLNPYYLVGSNYSIPFIFHSDTQGNLSYSDLIFNDDGMIENSQTFNNVSYIGNNENFQINISYDSTYYTGVDAYLVYNGTSYPSNKTGIGNNVIFSRNLTMITESSQKNYSFYWSIALANASGNFYYNSSWNNQTVNVLTIDDCSAYNNTILNFTLKKERTQASYNATLEVIVSIYSSDGSQSILNYSHKFINITNAAVCMLENMNGTDYKLYAQANHYQNGYVTRNYYIRGYTFTNSSTNEQKIDLFGLESTYATKFIVVYKGTDFAAVEDALIIISRQYVSDNQYKTVEIELTDYLGEATAYFDLDQNPKYTIVVTKNGEVLSTFNEISVFCDTYATQCKLNLDALSTSGIPVDLYTYNNIAFSSSFNSTTRTYSLSYSTLDGSSSVVSINITKFDGYMNETLCSSQLISSSGLITCAIPDYDNITFITSIYKDAVLIAYDQDTIAPTSYSVTFAGNVVIISVGLVLTFGLMFIPSAVGVVIGVIIASIVATGLFFINGNALFGSVFIGLTIIGGIIIWKLRTGGND